MTSGSANLPRQPESGELYDGLLIFMVGVLMTLGAVMAYSTGISISGAELDFERWWQTPLKQTVFAVAGFLAMVLAAMCDYRWLKWERAGRWWPAAGLWCLAVVLVAVMYVPGVGLQQLGATRSIILIPGLFTFQPPEVAKIAMVVALAALLASPYFNVRQAWPGLVVAMGCGGVLIGLVAIEDFGTAALMGVVMMLMLVLGGARWWHLMSLGAFGAVAGAGFIAMKPYRWQRIVTFFTEDADPQGAGYQIQQALMAIGAGGWWGRGLGAGVQKHDYLPQANNDFVLAIVCEELGIIGGMVVAAVFVAILWRGWWLVRRSNDPFGRLLAAGLTLMICLQAAFNVGVVTQSVPTKGISLPFVSAGGSGVLFLGLAAGLLASVGRADAQGAWRADGATTRTKVTGAT